MDIIDRDHFDFSRRIVGGITEFIFEVDYRGKKVSIRLATSSQYIAGLAGCDIVVVAVSFMTLLLAIGMTPKKAKRVYHLYGPGITPTSCIVRRRQADGLATYGSFVYPTSGRKSPFDAKIKAFTDATRDQLENRLSETLQKNELDRIVKERKEDLDSRTILFQKIGELNRKIQRADRIIETAYTAKRMRTQ